MAMKWHGDKVMKDMNNEMNKRLAACAIEWTNYATSKLNEKTNRDGKTPSKKGEFPAMVTSHLRRNIAYELFKTRLAARVGTNVVYGKHLELGTRKMAKRPWMSLTNKAMKSRIKQILGRKIKG